MENSFESAIGIDTWIDRFGNLGQVYDILLTVYLHYFFEMIVRIFDWSVSKSRKFHWTLLHSLNSSIHYWIESKLNKAYLTLITSQSQVCLYNSIQG